MPLGDFRLNRAVRCFLVAAVMLTAGLVTRPVAARDGSPAERPAGVASNAGLDAAQRHFYNARYEEAADVTRDLCAAAAPDPAACELRSSAIHFQIKRLLGESEDRDAAWKACAACPTLMAAFVTDVERGLGAARARLALDPADDEALFFLGKLDLNYVWLQLGTIGRRTGWSEYWEARRSLDKVLARNPDHLRARVARAWIDYIVDTRLPRGTKWLLGGGNKKRGLLVVREASQVGADFYSEAEADFALWDMQVREKDFGAAVATARALARDFPENGELARFLERHAAP